MASTVNDRYTSPAIANSRRHPNYFMTDRIRVPLASLIGLVFAILAGCSQSHDPAGPEPSGPITFKADIQPIFNARCGVSGCHVQPLPRANCDLSPGVSYANLVNVPTEVYVPGVRVTPGEPDSSVLYLLVQKGIMPARGGRLTLTQVAAIKKWIEDGAPDN